MALVEKTLKANESALSLGEGKQKDYKLVEEMAKSLKISKKDQHEWYDDLLTKLIRERR